ncbi:MAG: metallophosphoesterase [Planctomycetaceae bacterium]
MTRILQLTDLHVFSEPHVRLKGIPTRECLQDVVNHILQTEAPFDHVVITGDHTHDERPASYQAVREILSPFGDRLWQVPGNHDDRSVLRSVFPDRTGSAADPYVTFHFTDGPWLCLGLDTHLPGEVSGIIQHDQIDWITAQLQASAAERVALFCHHPPVDVNSVWMDAIGLRGRELLQDVVRNDSRIRLVCCGHVHHDFHSTVSDADVYATPSTGIQFDPAGDVPRFSRDAPGYRVIELDGLNCSTVVKRLPVAEYFPVVD